MDPIEVHPALFSHDSFTEKRIQHSISPSTNPVSPTFASNEPLQV